MLKKIKIDIICMLSDYCPKTSGLVVTYLVLLLIIPMPSIYYTSQLFPEIVECIFYKDFL